MALQLFRSVGLRGHDNNAPSIYLAEVRSKGFFADVPFSNNAKYTPWFSLPTNAGFNHRF